MKLSKLFLFASISLGVALFASCNADDGFEELTHENDVNSMRTCEVKFNVTKTEYDHPASRATQTWKEGDKIYLTFNVGSSTTSGNAKYTGGKWVLSYYGSLNLGVESTCAATYIENPEYSTNDFVKFSEKSAIYEDLNGKYLFTDTLLSVTAGLSPKVGRLRFAGNEGDSAMVHGISYYTSYDVISGKYGKSSSILKAKVDSTKYTPYIYGEFVDSVSPRLNVVTPRSGYSKVFSTSIYKKGESGYVNFPQKDSHNGWYNYLTFSVNGVSFNMLPVEKVTTEETSDGIVEQYSVFFLAETETTNALYNAVFGLSSTSQKPYATSSWDSFLTSLRSSTSINNFRYPTPTEWKYAAKGGMNSQGYTYSGSNNIDEVAWYSGNSSNTTHAVKLKARNELGFYDMSGNLNEMVLSGNYYYYYGGSYYDDSSYCENTSYRTSSSYSYIGFRVALSF